MARPTPLFGGRGGWADKIQDGVYRVIVGRRRSLALSMIANVVLLALLAFKTAPEPVPLDSGKPCLAPLIGPQAGRAATAAETSAAGSTNSASAAAAAAAAVAADAYPVVPSGRKAWLAFGIPSAPRKGSPPYLAQTLESLLAELPDDPTDPLYGRIRVIVMDTAPGRNHAVTRLRGRLRAAKKGDGFAAKAAAYVEVLDSQSTVPDPRPGAAEPDDLNNPDDRPGSAVRRQTGDLIELLEIAAGRAQYYMFLEDDFRVCPFMLRALHYALAKAHVQQPDWLALRISYGMNGVLLRTKDVRSLVRHLQAGMARKPPDILWQEWAVGDDRPQENQRRPLVVYRYNMLAHIGVVSSFAVRMARPRWPGCYAPMDKAWSLHLRERYKVDECENLSDLSPCARRLWRDSSSLRRSSRRGGSGSGSGKEDAPLRSWMEFQLAWPRAAAGPSPSGPPVKPDGLLPKQAAQDTSGGGAGGRSWIRSLIDDSVMGAGSRGSGGSEEGPGNGSGSAFREGAYADNFGRRKRDDSSNASGAGRGRGLGSVAGSSSSLGTAYAVDAMGD